MPIPFTRGDVEDAFFRMVNKSNEKPDRSERFDKVMEFRLVAMKLVGVDLQKLVDTLPTRQMREYTNLRTSVLTELFRPPASLQPKPRRGGGLFAGLRW